MPRQGRSAITISMPAATTFIDLDASRYTQVAAAALIAWDYFLTLDHEVEYFWRRGRVRPTLLFLTNRYFPILVTIANAFMWFYPRVTNDICNLWHHILFMGAVLVEMFVVQAILITRLHAMYKDSKYMLRCLLALYTISMATSLTGLGLVTRHNIPDPQPTYDTNICFPNFGGQLWPIGIPPLVFDIVALVLAARRSWIYIHETPFFSRTRTTQVLEIIVRDSLFHFLLLSLVYTVNVLMLRVVPHTLQRSMDGLSITAISILGTRMVINLKETGDNAWSTVVVHHTTSKSCSSSSL